MLTDRKQKILQIIVEEYVRTSLPISSESVAQRMPVSVSSATIRNDVAELEEEGYVVRPYPSAGGVPSDKAYRAYVESLGKVAEPPLRVRELVMGRFRQAPMDIEAWSRVAVQLLADLVRTMAVATPPQAPEARWKHLELVSLQEFLTLIIMVFKESRLKQRLLPVKAPTSQDELTQISNKLNATYAGLSRHAALAKPAELTPFEEEVTHVALDLLTEEEQPPVHYVEGLRHMLSYPELAAGPWARNLAELLEEQDLVGSILREAPNAGVVRVVIGAENKADLLRPFSVVFTQYGVPSEASGAMGIVGPTRMEYATAISSVKYLAYVMSEMVGGVQGRSS